MLNLPNLLTLSRLPLAVVLFGCIAGEAWVVALAVFLLASLTDWLDGFLARKLGQCSAFGRAFDPLIDKVLVCGAFIFLMPFREAGLAPWMVTLVVGRELLITGLRGFVEGKQVAFGADWLGKLKMGLQCAVLIGLLLVFSLRELGPRADGVPLTALTWLCVGLLDAMLLATLLSGLQYVWRASAYLRTG